MCTLLTNYPEGFKPLLRASALGTVKKLHSVALVALYNAFKNCEAGPYWYCRETVGLVEAANTGAYGG